MSNNLERRSYEFEVRSEKDENGDILTGRPIVYNSRTDLGDFYEIIDSGALDGADLTDVRFLVNHNLDMIPLARTRRNNGNSTMKLSVDKDGLKLDFVRLDTENNADARALQSAVKRGDITGMSFMFSIDADSWEDVNSDHPTRHIEKIGKVIEISAVTFPAYDDTEINARNAETLDKARQALDNVRGQAVDTVNLELEKAKLFFKIKAR